MPTIHAGGVRRCTSHSLAVSLTRDRPQLVEANDTDGLRAAAAEGRLVVTSSAVRRRSDSVQRL